MFLGLPPVLWGQEEYLKESCCPLGFGLVPYAPGNEPSWPLVTHSGVSVQELRMGGPGGSDPQPRATANSHLSFLSVLRSRGSVQSVHVSGNAFSSVFLELKFNLLNKEEGP